MARPCQSLFRYPLYGTLHNRYFTANIGSKLDETYDRETGHEKLQESFTFVASLKDCAKKKDISRGIKLHAHVVELGLLERSPYLASALINMYAKCSMVAKAHEVINDLPVRNVASWNALISGYAQQGQFHEALDCFEQMQCESLSPNAITFTGIFKACGDIGNIGYGERMHDEIVKRGLFEKTGLCHVVKCHLLQKHTLALSLIDSQYLLNQFMQGHT